MYMHYNRDLYNLSVAVMCNNRLGEGLTVATVHRDENFHIFLLKILAVFILPSEELGNVVFLSVISHCLFLTVTFHNYSQNCLRMQFLS